MSGDPIVMGGEEGGVIGKIHHAAKRNNKQGKRKAAAQTDSQDPVYAVCPPEERHRIGRMDLQLFASSSANSSSTVSGVNLICLFFH